MLPLAAMLAIGAGVGAIKSEAIDRPREQRQRKLAAETARLSPWTGMRPGAIQEADLLGSSISGGLTGAQLGMGMAKDEAVLQGMKNYPSRVNYNVSGEPLMSNAAAAQAFGSPGFTPAYQAPQMSPWSYRPNPGYSLVGGS